ncbi:MAG: hypothetical protein EOP39_01690 [Rubrivivax sp.]|nr:MAG: hypothetical protein EOP39_01690 [Rubrivivax sp.]
MKFLLPALLLSLAATMPAHAGPKADALAACLGDSTTGKDRKDLARWIFIAMSSHPEIKPLSAVGETHRDEADASAAKLFDSLLTERCRKQASEAVQQEGQAGMVTAFQTLGALAMQELMGNPDVTAAVGRFEQRLDRAKVEAALAGK